MSRLLVLVLIDLSVSGAQVSIFPSGIFVSIPGGTATFNCISTDETISTVQWIVNGVNSENPSLRPYIFTSFTDLGLGIGTLEIRNIPESFNETSLHCIANVRDTTFVSANATLLLQGALTAVNSLTVVVRDSTIFLNWTPPFTLDIRQEIDDIQGYCVNGNVELINDTITRTLFSECVSVTEFQYQIANFDGCSYYILSVFATNVVGNGTRSAVFYYWNRANYESFSVLPRKNNDGVAYSFSMSAPVCTAKLTFVDLDTGNRSTLEKRYLNITGSNITFNGDLLTTNRRYSVIISVTNAAGSTTSYTVIGTHDISNVLVVPSDRMVTIEYNELSKARGALCSFAFISDNGDVNFNRSVLIALSRNTSSNYTLDLYPGHYQVYVYDIEYDGRLSNGVEYPAIVKDFFITMNSTDSRTHKEENCNASADAHVVTVRCNNLHNFQVIAQLTSEGMLYTNHSMNPVTVQVNSTGMYQVAVFPMRVEDGVMEFGGTYFNLVEVNDSIETATTTAISTDSRTVDYVITVSVMACVVVVLVPVLVVVLSILCISQSKCKRHNKKSLSVKGEFELAESATADNNDDQVVTTKTSVHQEHRGTNSERQLGRQPDKEIQPEIKLKEVQPRQERSQGGGNRFEEENQLQSEDQPETGQPENKQPENEHPENGQPENKQPENGQPEHEQPKNRQPENGQPENEHPENLQPENGPPKNGQPENRELEAGQLDAELQETSNASTEEAPGKLCCTPSSVDDTQSEPSLTSSNNNSSVQSAKSQPSQTTPASEKSDSKEYQKNAEEDKYFGPPELQKCSITAIKDTGISLRSGKFFFIIKEFTMEAALYAGKMLNEGNDPNVSEGADLIKKIEKECELLANLRHPNVVQFMGIHYREPKYPVLIMERIDSSLGDMLKKQPPLSLQTKLKILFDVSKALVFLHNRKEPIIHANLSVDEVAVNSRLQTAKLMGFENARGADDKDLETVTTAQNYMPPEAFLKKSIYETSLDIFSFGHLTLVTIAQNYSPKNDSSAKNEFERRRACVKLPDNFNDNNSIMLMVRLCLSDDKNCRLTAKECSNILQTD